MRSPGIRKKLLSVAYYLGDRADRIPYLRNYGIKDRLFRLAYHLGGRADKIYNTAHLAFPLTMVDWKSTLNCGNEATQNHSESNPWLFYLGMGGILTWMGLDFIKRYQSLSLSPDYATAE